MWSYNNWTDTEGRTDTRNTPISRHVWCLHKHPIPRIDEKHFEEARCTTQPHIYCNWYKSTEMHCGTCAKWWMKTENGGCLPSLQGGRRSADAHEVSHKFEKRRRWEKGACLETRGCQNIPHVRTTSRHLHQKGTKREYARSHSASHRYATGKKVCLKVVQTWFKARSTLLTTSCPYALYHTLMESPNKQTQPYTLQLIGHCDFQIAESHVPEG